MTKLARVIKEPVTLPTPAKYEHVLNVLKLTGQFNAAADSVAVAVGTLKRWRENDVSFDARCEQAREVYADTLEREADRRAVKGVSRDIYHRGEVVGEKIEYSDPLLMFRLKALRPDIYRENNKIEINNVNVDNGTSVSIVADIDAIFKRWQILSFSPPLPPKLDSRHNFNSPTKPQRQISKWKSKT